MKIDARITLLFDSSGGGATIEITDNTSSTTFFSGHMTAAQACSMLGRLGRCEMESAEVRGLDRVGKLHEWKNLEFELPPGEHGYGEARRAVAEAEARKVCPEGWHVTPDFNSQGSFFKQEGKNYARCTIRRWVDVNEEGT